MLIEKEGIIVVVTTKNRNELLKRALNSVFRQTKQPLEVIVSSDSDEDIIDLDRSVAEMYNFSFLRNKYTKNYAGNLNTAIEYIVSKYLYDLNYDINKLFIAFLDDDDYWDKFYLRECYDNRIPNNDVVIAGINYHKDSETIPLTIPMNLSINSFLEGNPHVQGSNTFIRLSLILRAGCFDENMDSTTDRDFFTRVFMLKPNVAIINKHLVEVDASDIRNRLTNNKKGKKKSLEQFYIKYGGLMSNEIENKFFQRAKTFGVDISKNKIKTQFIQKRTKSNDNYKINTSIDNSKKVCFSFISTDINYFRRLAREIADLDYPNKKIISFVNVDKNTNSQMFEAELKELKIEYFLFDINDAKLKASNGSYGSFVKSNFQINGNIKEIAVSRTILQLETYEQTKEGDVIYVLDEDIRLCSLKRNDNEFNYCYFDLKGYLARYYGKADAVIGNYSGDAPIPALSTLRTSLLDYVYSKKLKKNDIYNGEAYYYDDYYYSSSDKRNIYNETPLPLVTNGTLKELLGGKALSRPLFEKDFEEFVPIRRGGNTLIFNRELLLIPNYSLKIGDITTRRGDSLWIYLAKNKGYKIIGTSISLYQDRLNYKFNLEKELKKEIEDILGYAAVKSIYKHDLRKRTLFNQEFIKYCKHRTVRFALDLFRIIGLLTILNDKYFKNIITSITIYDFVRKIKELTDKSFVVSSFDEYRSHLCLEDGRTKIDRINRFVEDTLKIKKSTLIGYGQEGAVFVDKNYTYKIFYNKDNLKFLKFKLKTLQNVANFPKNIIFDDSLEYAFCKYETLKNVKPYSCGYAKDFALLLKELRTQGLTINNLKKDNFLVSNNSLVYIDLGRSIIPYTIEDYDRAVERCYQILQYSDLNRHDFKILISKTYHDNVEAINYNLSVFKDLIKDKRKEEIHDPLIIDLIDKYNPSRVLDFGAGKCKIANTISKKHDVYVYDIDRETLLRRASKDITIIKNINSNAYVSYFDMVVCNKVLCCIDDKDNEDVLDQIEKVLINNGRLILSVCSPFFENIDKTTTRTLGYKGKYEITNKYTKGTIYGNRTEYHRAFYYYEKLLQKHGFKIANVYEDEGIDVSTLNYISEHVIFDCIKEEVILNDDSLITNEKCLNDKSKYPKTTKEMALFLYGKNTPTTKLRRLLKSLKEQSFNDYEIVYIDDASTNLESLGYIEMISKYDSYFKEKMIFIKNNELLGMSCCFENFYKNICINPNTIIININSGDAFINKDSLLKIYNRFKDGADLTIGNCFRVDKSLKKYNLISFKNVWERNGDNIWLHPKCFRRYLCEYIQDNMIKDGKYIDDKNDFAIMLPMIQHANNPQFIEDIIYLYDPSSKWQNKTINQNMIHNWLFKKAKKESERKTIAIIGDSNINEDSDEYKISFQIGKILADYEYNIQNGGMGGVMEATFKGAKSSSNYRQGSTIAIIPSLNKEDANPYADVIIPTGLDMLRNAMVVEADAVIAIGGGCGTLSEIAFAWRKYKLIIAVSSIKGWSEKIANLKLDDRERYPDYYEDKIYGVKTPEEIIEILNTKLHLYTKQFHGIKRRNN